jgi:hypothetical protein
MQQQIKRRAAFKPIALGSAVALFPGLLLACSKKPECTDVTALSPADLHTRDDVAKYVDQTLEATKRCSICAQYIAAAPNQCGTCKVVKGPINPDGACTLFSLKQG